ncbi:hypothetical protein OHB54_46480 (plasmid) [Streptomyces sp. NBC_01007]|nr:hypothetical protein OHB54_46480 [Streptomyces sp. NBC_01007]
MSNVDVARAAAEMEAARARAAADLAASQAAAARLAETLQKAQAPR